ncbi:MAG TPA: efflux RND transporter periplasmic adaptor subunit [Verrucomicrobia bacterium]|nr:efflux RND transporter periplasmic adaptor subunit [Verrucomicrobiota bacterium]HOB34015.1 efflux RND transporter periplasmic adaptor subunit [Verrucomicrobiota bacterium]HOP98501.1 efflux RND transporter periplasmic adaptor subunit [Verrucomicrobiota bacterium]HPU55419.1 efflux RND transporter periplasmic adaptor subunit [Verrucomicrobiota bacterium]
MKLARVLPVLLVALMLGTVSCRKAESAATDTAAQGAPKYHCPMHPTYTSDRPGDCPICNMSLVPIGGGDHSAPSIAGRVSVVVSPEKRQTIGLTLSPVERRALSDTVRAVGVVEHDETRFARIAPRFGGWVRKVQVNYTGQPVKQGDPLFTVYSPDLFTAENDYALALQSRRIASNAAAGLPDPSTLAEAARRRLELLEVGDDELRRLEEGGKPTDEIQMRSPLSGHVIAKNVVEGQAFQPGDVLYEIADLSRLWVRAAVHESDLPRVRIGQKGRVLFPNLGGKQFESSVTFIYPHINPQTRRAEVRLELDNPEHVLRPEMWANVELEVSIGEVLSVPASAVIDTGTRFIAFVDGEKDHLEPREVTIGARGEEYWEVTGGLKEGERVVTRALFLIDSESQLKSVVTGMGGASEHQH